MRRARSAAGLLAGVTVAAAAVLITVIPAQAVAPPGPPVAAQAAAPTTTSNGTRTLIVDETTDLPVENATIAVQGKGFDVTTGLYIAVCADGSGAPEKLTKCVGGAIPDGNTGTGWAHITEKGDGTGGVKAAWGPDGSFDVTLALPKVDEGDVNCVTGKCSIYTSSDDPAIRTEDNTVPVTFAAPPPPTTPSSTTPTSTAPTTPTAPSTPGTAVVQVISTPDIEAGKTQLVVFSGFTPDEQVNLTLFSDPITLSPVTADQTGVARAEFVVPADFPAGTHRLEAIGQQSRTVGVASFRVTAPPPPTTASSTPSTSASPSTTASSTPASSSASSSAAPSSSSAAPTTAVTPTNTDSGSSLWWLWLIIGIVVLAGIITAIVVYRRNKEQQQREADEQAITDAAAREQAATGPYDAPTVVLPPVRPGGPPPGEDPYGLLSGRDHPDNPTLYSGDPAGPTQVLGGAGGQQPAGPDQPDLPTAGLRPPPDSPAGGSTGDGPHTEAWTPDEDDTAADDTDRPDSGPPRS